MAKSRRRKGTSGKQPAKAVHLPVANNILPVDDGLDEPELIRRAVEDATAAFKKFANELGRAG